MRHSARRAVELVMCLTSLASAQSKPQTAVVKIVKTAAGYELLRDGKPYLIKGAGGWAHLEDLKSSGGNSIRTWGAKTDGALLDRAQALGMTVTFGIWLGHKEHGFGYHDAQQVKKQYGQSLDIVRQYKNHTALLIWGVGNEMEGVEGMESGSADPAVWNAVEDIVRAIKKLDPNHPVITVIAEFDNAKVSAIKKYCPSLDALGINSYGRMPTLPERLKEAGWDKPYIITEFGPAGPWQSDKTTWGAPIEESSTAKAAGYLLRYQATIASRTGWCLGSYVYFWGIEPRIVQTHTWYEMFLPDNEERLGAVDVMTLAWTGRLPVNSAPQILYWQTDAALQEVEAGSQHSAMVLARDPDNDALTYRWEVREESPEMTGPPPPVVPESLRNATGNTLTYIAPKKPGGYRLFVYVFDGKGNAATANIPFYVKASSTKTDSSNSLVLQQ
jgi:glycosyl hydrolase family 2